MGLPKVAQLEAGRATIQTSSVDSAKSYQANITHDGKNRQYQELLSEFKTLRKWVLFLMQFIGKLSFFTFILPPFCKIS